MKVKALAFLRQRGKLAPVLNQVPQLEDVCRSEGIVPRILNVGIILRLVVSFTLRSFYSQGKSPPVPIRKEIWVL
jgi:hypothetical protein